MRSLIIGFVASAGLITAAPAAAEKFQNIIINGKAEALCNVSGNKTATIASGGSGGAIAGADGFLDTGVQSRITTALSATNTRAWCSGLSNITVRRTPLVRTGTTGGLDSSGFANAVGYDVGIKIAGAARKDNFVGTNGLQEGSSNGATGADFLPFGPTGEGKLITFVNDSWMDENQTFNATPITLNLTSSPSFDGSSLTLRGQGVAGPTRLAAGDYKSTVTITLTPAGFMEDSGDDEFEPPIGPGGL